MGVYHHEIWERHAHGKTWLHRTPGALKCFAALLLVILVVLAPRQYYLGYGLIGVLLLLGFAAAGIPFRSLLGRLMWVEPLVIATGCLTLFQPDGTLRFLFIITKSTLSLCALLLLSGTTPFGEILRLLGKLRVPPLFITTIALMYRYAFVLVEEAARMNRARSCRRFKKSSWHEWISLSAMLGQLFVRSVERAERIYAAMCARGWKGM